MDKTYSNCTFIFVPINFIYILLSAAIKYHYDRYEDNAESYYHQEHHQGGG